MTGRAVARRPRWPSAVLCALWLALGIGPALAQDARELFSQHRNLIYQIRVIELASGKQAALGSGFRVSADGLVVTNYHVISEILRDPDRFRLQAVAFDQTQIDAVLMNFDVVNDLALLRVAHGRLEPLKLAAQLPQQGDPIYSIGNPHDLGWTVVPGTYNGLAAHSFYERIHFSGSVNPGMSGGPALDAAGEVVGVNVASAGNQVSFLIPLHRLRAFLAELPAEAFDLGLADQRIGAQLFANQQRLLGSLIEADWELSRFGEATVPGEIAWYIRCWGQADRDPEIRYTHSMANCNNDELVYLSEDFQTGAVLLHFGWFTSDELNRFQFYNMFRERLSRVSPDNPAEKEDVTNFSCHDDLVRSPGRDAAEVVTKTTFCVRSYRRYPGLYDVIYLGGTVHEDRKALLSHFTLSGVSRELAEAFLRKFLENVRWN